MAGVSPRVSVVVGVDGAGRTRRLDEIAAAHAGPVVRVSPPGDLPVLPDGGLVLVDDAHRLTDEHLRSLAAAARSGLAVVVARRPTIHNVALADLDEVAAAQGRVHWLEPFDVDGVTGLIAAATGRRPTPEFATAVWQASAGLPAIVVTLADNPDPSAAVPPALLARVQRRLALLDPATAGLSALLALRLALTDTVLRAASELDERAYATAMRTLNDAGLLVPGTEAMIPAVAAAILSDLPAAQRRRVHEAVARALAAHGADPLAAAEQMRAARVFVPASAEVYAAAGDRLRFSDPGAALGWYADALESGVDPARIIAGQAEASALVGVAPPVAGSGTDPRMSFVDGAVAAHHGRLDRSASVLVAVAEPGPLLAVPALVATGRLDDARAAAGTAGPPPLRLLAEAALAAATDPAGAVPRFIEAAEAYERNPPPYVLPDTPHALGALVASLAGDVGSAEHLLGRALAAAAGGPVAAARHRLLLAWVRLRAGRYDTAVAELGTVPRSDPPGRDGLLRAAVSAGVARRSGDIAKLREAWGVVEPMLARRTVDVSHVEALEELSVAAARLRQKVRMEPVLELLDAIVVRLGQPWQVAAGWVRLQVAIAEEDPATADVVAARLGAVCAGGGGGRRQAAQCAAGSMWARVLTGDVAADAVIAVGDQLAAAELPWEGSRLVGQAAIRTTDAAAARRLLEHARELSSAEVVAAEGRAESQYGGLSEREVEVARMVLAGGTHREIGARLFISPKTVEHHVARIRTKLGATNRAEFVATLRTVLGAAAEA